MVHPNPWGREYSPVEWRAASFLYSQYIRPEERHGGPLIYKNGEQLCLEVDREIFFAESKLENLRLLRGAVYRETTKGLVDD